MFKGVEVNGKFMVVREVQDEQQFVEYKATLEKATEHAEKLNELIPCEEVKETQVLSLNEITLKMVEKVELENRYGNLSCYDYPKQYEQMTDLEVEICEALDKYNENEYSKRSSDLYANIEDIAKDIVNGNIDAENMDLQYYSINEWIEVYISSDMEEAEKNTFESLFYYMPTDVRNGWLEGNHLANFTNTYTNVMIEYILMVHE